MKKVIAVLSIFLIFVVNSFAGSLIDTKRETYKSFVEEIIPEELVAPFLERTFDNGNVDIGLELLAMGKKESQWKRKVVGRNRDAEGNILSYDYGPLQLNSNNIESFSKKYGISWKESNYNSDIYYMCICIDYYKDLRTKYSEAEAWMAYNGGEYRVKHNCVRKVVKEYAEDVYNLKLNLRNDWLKVMNNAYREYQIVENLKRLQAYTGVTKLKVQKVKPSSSMKAPFVAYREIPYWFRKEEYFC